MKLCFERLNGKFHYNERNIDMAALFSVVLMILYLVVLIYVLTLFIRFVKAIEKIADKIDNSSKI
jgi:hypothetical protein